MNYENLKQTLTDNTFVRTENGALGYASTGKALLDLNFKVSSLRNVSDLEIINLYALAFYENPTLAIKWLFFARDIRQGLGERRLFKVCFEWLLVNNENAVNLIEYIAEYGRWDEVVEIATNSKNAYAANTALILITKTLRQDLDAMKINKPISLLAKWMPSINTSSDVTIAKAHLLASKCGLKPKEYRKMLSSLRAYSDVLEVKLCSNRWEDVKYPNVPSIANLKYKTAFYRHDEERYSAYINSVNKGEVKMNMSVTFPHQIVTSYNRVRGLDKALEAMWKSLPANEIDNTIVVADGSGSMETYVSGRTTALDVANSLAIYFAERNKGEFANKYITFSETPQIVNFSNCKTLKDKLDLAKRYNEVANTNIKAVFELILKTAIRTNCSQEEMPKNILILSDMEFDSATYSRNAGRVTSTLFNIIAKEYEQYGYKLPRLIFWNIASRTGAIPVKQNELGVALVSGFSVNNVKMIMDTELDPYKLLVKTLMSERYSVINI